MPLRLVANYGRAALLRRHDIGAAQQRGPTGMAPRSVWRCAASFVNQPDRHRTNCCSCLKIDAQLEAAVTPTFQSATRRSGDRRCVAPTFLSARSPNSRVGTSPDCWLGCGTPGLLGSAPLRNETSTSKNIAWRPGSEPTPCGDGFYSGFTNTRRSPRRKRDWHDAISKFRSRGTEAPADPLEGC